MHEGESTRNKSHSDEDAAMSVAHRHALLRTQHAAPDDARRPWSESPRRRLIRTHNKTGALRPILKRRERRRCSKMWREATGEVAATYCKRLGFVLSITSRSDRPRV